MKHWKDFVNDPIYTHSLLAADPHSKMSQKLRWGLLMMGEYIPNLETLMVRVNNNPALLEQIEMVVSALRDIDATPPAALDAEREA